MPSVTVVGSGASAVHFARTVLERGWDVTMVDAGGRAPRQQPPGTFNDLKDTLDDPVAWFLGERLEGVITPDTEKEYYGIPPGKEYVFELPTGFRYTGDGFEPLFSFARGGLAEAWTAGCYPFNDAELEAFPFGWTDLAPHYAEVARRIGVTGEADDLAPFMPLHDHLLPPLRLDRHSELLLAAYGRRREVLHRRLGCHVGRTRVATLTEDRGSRRACRYLGRCLWGCPVGALYTPSHTLEECLEHPRFTYIPNTVVTRFLVNDDGRVTGVALVPREGGSMREVGVERLVLAAGALSTSAIVLRSVRGLRDAPDALPGLMDNRQILVPFLTWGMLGRPYEAESYQYHLLGLGIATDDPRAYVHGQITTLTTALMHPIVQRLPFDLRTAAAVGRLIHSALGVVNVNFHDTRREANTVALETAPDGTDRLVLRYRTPDDEPARLARGVAIVRRALRVLGCFPPRKMMHVRPMGASVHYAGTLPMTSAGGPWTATPDGRLRAFQNLWLADGVTFPFLPAKNITFTLMANATRIATTAF